MRILHVVTLASPDAAYGGPLRVALNQVRELRSRGHEVTLVAGGRGYAELPVEIDGVGVTLFPANYAVPRVGFAGLTSRPMRKWLRANVGSFDVVHVHFARDLVALPAARVALKHHVPLVLQPHGMVDESSRVSAHVLDSLATLRVLRNATAVLYLTASERESIEVLAGERVKSALTALPNGVPAVTQSVPTASAGPVEFLFLGRLAPRKRPTWLADAVVSAAKSGLPVVATFIGPDEGLGPAIDTSAAQNPQLVRRETALAPSQTLDRMARADVFALPTERDTFPMALLEAMSIGMPVIVMSDCGVAEAIEAAEAGLVARDQSGFDSAVASLARDPELRRTMGAAAAQLVSQNYSMRGVVDSLEDIYRGTSE